MQENIPEIDPENLSEIDGILHALGEMNAAWGHFEDSMFLLLFDVIGLKEPHAMAAIRNEIDLKTATAIMRSAALLNETFELRDEVLRITKTCDRPLREHRNRFVHDAIYVGASLGFEMHQYVTRSTRPQSFQKPKVSAFTTRRVTRQLLQDFTHAIRRTDGFIGVILHHLDEEEDDYTKPFIDAGWEGAERAIASYIAATKTLGAKV